MVAGAFRASKGGAVISHSEPEEVDTYDYEAILNYGNYSDYGYHDYNCGFAIFDDPEVLAIYYIQLVVCPILLFQGIVGNLLAIPALYSISRTAWSTISYLALLGGTDLIILLVRCGDTWYQQVVAMSLSQKIMNYSDAVCRTYNFAFMFVKHMNPWLVTATAVEMMIATRWPKKTYIMCTLERARYVLMLMTIIIVCLDINHFWTYGVPRPGIGCRYTEEFSENFRDWIWPALDNSVELILPLVVVSICFFLTATTMIRRPRSHEHDLEMEMKKYFLELSTLRDFRTICLIICLVFICLSTIKITLNVTNVLFLRGYIDIECQAKTRFHIRLELFKVLDQTLTFLFYGIKIYLYLALSATFRAKLKQGFLWVGRKLKQLVKMACGCRRKWTPVSVNDSDGNNAERGQAQSPIEEDDSASMGNSTAAMNHNDMATSNTSDRGSKELQSRSGEQAGIDTTQDSLDTHV